MRIVEIREKTVPISRYADPGMSSGGLNTTAIAAITDVHRNGLPIVGFGGHLFSLHVAAALGLGGSESNPHNFQPFGGFSDGALIKGGSIYLQESLAEAPGIGFETRPALAELFRSLL